MTIATFVYSIEMGQIKALGLGIIAFIVGLLSLIFVIFSLKSSKKEKLFERIIFKLDKNKSTYIELHPNIVYQIIRTILKNLNIEFSTEQGKSHFLYETYKSYNCKNDYAVEVRYGKIDYQLKGLLGVMIVIGPISKENEKEIKKVQKIISKQMEYELNKIKLSPN